MTDHSHNSITEAIARSICRSLSDIQGYQNHRVPAQITSESDLKGFVSAYREIPLLTRKDLTENSRLYQNPNLRPCRICSTGGTTSQPVYLPRTVSEISDAERSLATIFRIAGLRSGETIAIALPFGMWNIGHLAMRGAELAGLQVLPIGANASSEAVHSLIAARAPLCFIGHPTAFRDLTSHILRHGGHTENIGVTKILWAGEFFSNEDRDIAQEQWTAMVQSVYGSEELDGLGSECEMQHGIHSLPSDNFYEIVDPKDHRKSLSPGQVGRLVVTTLFPRALPLLRYDTGDLASWIDGPCPCGHPSPRFILHGRSDQFLLLPGATKLYVHDVQVILISARLAPTAWQTQLLSQTERPEAKILRFLLDMPAAPQEHYAKHIIDELTQVLMKTIDLGDELCSGALSIDVIICSSSAFHRSAKGKTPQLIDRSEQLTEALLQRKT